MGLEFTDELSLVDFIKCLSEIKDRGGIWVVTNMHIGHQTYIGAGLNDGLFSEMMDFRDFPSVLSAVRIAQS